MRTMIMIAVSGILALAGCQSLPMAEPGAGGAERAMQEWIAAFNRCEPGEIAALYSPQALLWGTVSPALITTSAGVRQYFDRACGSPQRLSATLDSHVARRFDDTAVISGSYIFTVPAAGQPRKLPARFSFVFRRDAGQWLIVDHHSSAMPAPSAPAPPAR